MTAKRKPPTTVVTPVTGETLKPGTRWLPIQREQATGVASRSLSDEKAREKLIQSSAEILGSGIDPAEARGTVTGLVVGYVQSGKTLSFTTVIGLARDNGFPLVILIAGGKDPLLTQACQRLERDLDVDGGEGLPQWIMEKNPQVQNSQHEQLLRQTVDNWRDRTRDADEKPTFLVTVLKQTHRLRSLTALLRKVDLSGMPALVIDDEADQASLNTKVNQGQESTTYTRLRELRAALPCHTFLQYTATPQAPLLINIADTLSPDFVHVLEPGDGYVGGAEFFRRGSGHVEVIPPNDVLTITTLQTDPPASLLEALRLFFVGLTASIIKGTGRRSMLIHPARERVVHQESAQWASAIKDEWNSVLTASQGDPDRDEAIRDFKTAYDDLARTESALPLFEAIVEKLPRALRNTTVIEFNTRGGPKTPEIKWRHAEGWILVGGQAVDRGFTVDSLSVTYMPRGVGVGNADTLQQRARFFGYKRRYLGVCRVYLEQDLKDAFESYVEHEEIIRSELKRLADTGENLCTWRRRLVLDPSLHPCRQSVISDSYTRARPGGGWTQQRGVLMPADTLKTNTDIALKLVAKLQLKDDTTYAAQGEAQKHKVASDVPLADIVDMLVDYRCEDPRDTASFTGILVALGEAMRSDPDACAAFYVMRPKATGIHRTVSDQGTLEDGFQQGRTALAGGGTAYPGDTFFKASGRLTVQLHRYDLKNSADDIVARAAPLLAIHIPPALAKDWLVQIQAGQQVS